MLRTIQHKRLVGYNKRFFGSITADFVKSVSSEYNLGIKDDELNAYIKHGNISNILDDIERLHGVFESEIYSNKNEYKSRKYWIPNDNENEFNQWAIKCDIKSDNPTTNILDNKKIGIKDTVQIGGLPCMNGSTIYDGYIANNDATIISRILDNGGNIVGKATNENLCYSGGSHTSLPKAVLNPYNKEYSAGGSSSGSAVCVNTGDCDIAIGGDQGGSIRLPACFSGCYGHKQTWGMIPYTGIMSIVDHFDHIGCMGNNPSDIALLLDVLKGKDDIDYRQLNAPEYDPLNLEIYNEVKNIDSLKDVTIGVVKQGFDICVDNPWYKENNGNEVRERCLDDISNVLCRDGGCNVKEIDIPMHSDGLAIWSAIGIPLQYIEMYLMEGQSIFNRNGIFDHEMSKSFSNNLRNNNKGHDICITNKLNFIKGEYLRKHHGFGELLAKGKNLAKILKHNIETIMKENGAHVLAYPTIPMLPPKISDISDNETILERAFHIHNTCIGNITGHPIINIPLNKLSDNGLPIGLSIESNDYNDALCLNVANMYHKITGGLIQQKYK